MFPAVELQDGIGPIDPLQILAAKHNMTLYILAETMQPVSSQIPIGVTPFAPSILPTHTFADAPDDIQVLIVPGGPGVRDLQTSPRPRPTSGRRTLSWSISSPSARVASWPAGLARSTASSPRPTSLRGRA